MPKLILVVEDEESVRDLLIQLLSEEGYTVTGAPSAIKALQLLKTLVFDLVTLDLSMPEMDGNQFLKELEKSVPNIPVIIVVSAQTELLKSNSQVKAVIQKPFNIEQLTAVIEKYTA